MAELTVPFSLSESRELLQAAFERTREIQSYCDTGDQVVGKTGADPLIGTWGEEIIAKYRSNGDDTTVIEFDSRPIIGVNVPAKPKKYQDLVHGELKQLLDSDDPMSTARHAGRNKAVSDPERQRGIIIAGRNHSKRRFYTIISLTVFSIFIFATLFVGVMVYLYMPLFESLGTSFTITLPLRLPGPNRFVCGLF